MQTKFTGNNNFVEDFACWASDLNYDNIPDDVRDLVTLQLANQFAAVYSGYSNGGRHLTKPLLKQIGNGSTPVVGRSSVDPVEAVYLHSFYSMMHDYDDYLFMAHSGHGSVFTALALGVEQDVTAREIITNIVIGNELAGRLAGSTLLGPHNGQMWSFLHQATAAVITARLFENNEEIIMNALSLALYNPPFPNLAGFMDGHAKYNTASIPAASGVRCGLLASGDAVGNSDVLAGKGGFLDDFAYHPLPVLTALGESWVTRTISFKPYPGCAYLQTPLESLEQVMNDNSLKPDEVDSITVKASLPTVIMENHCDGFRDHRRVVPTNIAFSVKLSFALTLLEGEFSSSYLTDRHLNAKSERLKELSSKVTLEHDWGKTISVIEGIGKALDLGALASEVGYLNLMSSLRKMRKRHKGLSTFKEFGKLLLSGRLFKKGGILSSDHEWESFDFKKATLEKLAFNFGSTIRVKANGSLYDRELDRHSGAAGTTRGNKREIVEEKLRYEAGQYFSDVDSTGKLLDVLDSIDGLSARELNDRFVGI